MSMTWNSENRMTESISQNIYSGAKTLTRYKYDHEGNRVVKSSNYGEVVTPSAEISYRNDSIVTKHIFVSGVRVASKVCDDKSSNTYYQSVDHLGSTNILTDSKGEFYEHIETFPDGSIWVKEYVDQSGVNAVFTCHEMDVETKFFYAKARYYDAQLGRFISVDPIIGEYLPTGDKNRDKNMPGFGGFYNPVNINMYSYGANNPLKFVDPDGKATIICITYDDYGIEIGSHAAVVVTNPENTGYSNGTAILYDPGGSYNPKDAWGGPIRGSDDIIVGDDATKVENFVKYHLKGDNGSTKVEVYIFDTTPEQEGKIAERMEKLDGGQFLDCSLKTSKAIQIGEFFDDVDTNRFPGNLADNLEEIQKKLKILNKITFWKDGKIDHKKQDGK